MADEFAVFLVVLLVAMTGFTALGTSIPLQADTTAASLAVQPSSAASCEGITDQPAFPQGVSESGIDNATHLLEVHHTRLTNETYAERARWDELSRITENGTFQRFEVRSYTMAVKRDAEESLATLEGENETMVQWMTDNVTAIKIEDDADNATTYRYMRSDAHTDDQRQLQLPVEPWGFLVHPYLSAVDYEYAGTVTRENITMHAFTSTGLNETAQANQSPRPFSSSIENVTATILIDSHGIIRELNATETHARDNQTVTTSTNYSVRTSGEVTPGRPAWVCTQLPHLDASLSGNGTVIAVKHIGGMSVSTAGFTVSSANVSALGEFNGTFEAGDTLYLYATQDEPDRVRISRNERPAVNGSFVPFGGETLSVDVYRLLSGSYDSGAFVQLTVHENASESTGGESIANPTHDAQSS